MHRSETLGDNPREKRRLMRESLLPSFSVGFSGKRSVRTLHELGARYIILQTLRGTLAPGALAVV